MGKKNTLALLGREVPGLDRGRLGLVLANGSIDVSLKRECVSFGPLDWGIGLPQTP